MPKDALIARMQLIGEVLISLSQLAIEPVGLSLWRMASVTPDIRLPSQPTLLST